jgi:acyl-CoA-binding protein
MKNLKKDRILEVKGTSIRILNQAGQDYISITDMLKAKDGDFFHF